VTGNPRIALVVAVGENGVIGRDGRLPWRLPSDLKRFRALTLGKPMIMGRKTYESIGKPLDGRDTIVVTRRNDFAAPGVYRSNSIAEAIALATKLAVGRGVEEIAVIGGEEIFRVTLPLAHRIYLTRVLGAPTGDTYFPASDPAIWHESARERMQQTPMDEFAADFIVLDRQG
jgi:dihydrofolate reductase